MTPYEYWSLFITAFGALGTCGATGLALYFWYNDKKIRIAVQISHVDSFGNIKPEENGYFLVKVTNQNFFPVTLELAGLKAYEWKYFLRSQKYKAFMLFDNTEFDSLPKKLQYGDSYIFIKSMDDMYDKMKSLKKEMKVSDLVLVTCLSTAGRDLHTKVDKTVKIKLLN